MQKRNKKGQLGGLSPSIVVLGVAAISLVLILVVLQEMRDVDLLTETFSATEVNETLSSVDEAGENFAVYNYLGVNCNSVTNVLNFTDNVTIPASNYTQTGCSIAKVVDSGHFYNGTNWLVTYSHTHGDESYEQTNATLVGISTFGDFWTIIVLAIVAAVVIGIIFSAFGGMRRGVR